MQNPVIGTNKEVKKTQADKIATIPYKSANDGLIILAR
jgi:hypothetical protein